MIFDGEHWFQYVKTTRNTLLAILYFHLGDRISRAYSWLYQLRRGGLLAESNTGR